MKLKIHFIYVIIMALLTVSMIGCSNHSDKEAIYDSDELMLESGDSYFYSLRDDASEDVANQIDLSYRGFIGRDTIWTIQVDESTTIDFSYRSELRNGQFKIIIVTPTNEIHTLLSMSDEDTESITFPEGRYDIKFIGKNAFGSISMTIAVTPGVTLDKHDK